LHPNTKISIKDLIVGIDVGQPRLRLSSASELSWVRSKESRGWHISLGVVSFPVLSPRHSASLPAVWKNELTSPFLIDLGEKKFVYELETRHQSCGLMMITILTRQSWLLVQQSGALPHRKHTHGIVRGGSSGFQCIAFKDQKEHIDRPLLSHSASMLDHDHLAHENVSSGSFGLKH